MNTLTIEQTQHIIGKWIASCENEMQLDLCKEIILKYIVERYHGSVTDEVMGYVVADLYEKLSNQLRLITGTGLSVLN